MPTKVQGKPRELQSQIQAPYAEKVPTILSELSPMSDFIWGNAAWHAEG